MNMEIILTGSFGVGKSSIFNRFIHDDFDDKYYGTIGVRVNSRELEIGETKIDLKVWDIAGEVHQDRVPKTYFKDKDVIVYVVDLHRPFTFKKISSDLNYLSTIAPTCKRIVVGNKSDLINSEEMEEIEANEAFKQLDWLISAKTSKNLENLFYSIAKGHLTMGKT